MQFSVFASISELFSVLWTIVDILLKGLVSASFCPMASVMMHFMSYNKQYMSWFGKQALLHCNITYSRCLETYRSNLTFCILPKSTESRAAR